MAMAALGRGNCRTLGRLTQFGRRRQRPFAPPLDVRALAGPIWRLIRIMRLAILVLLPGLASAAVWPETIGAWKRTTVEPVTVAGRAVWDEYGLKEAETATYEKGAERFSATGYRMGDPTGAMAAFEWQRPAGSKDAPFGKMAAGTATELLAVHGNFLFAFTGRRPAADEWASLTGGLRNLDASSLPALPGFVPVEGLLGGSERYILGPVSLENFAPGIPPSVAGFSLGAEAQVASFRSPKGDMKLALFNYPTPQIAMLKVQEFQKVAGLTVKRSGPLVAAVLGPTDQDAAERLLAQVRYAAQITRDERMPTRRDNIGDLVINAFILIGILLGFSLVSGLTFGGVKAMRQLLRRGPEPEETIALHLSDR
jgi:hypothetical protein